MPPVGQAVEELLAQPSEDLTAEHGADQDRDQEGGDHDPGADPAGGNCHAGEQQDQVAWGKGEGNAELLDEHQSADQSDEGNPAELIDPCHRVEFHGGRLSPNWRVLDRGGRLLRGMRAG